MTDIVGLQTFDGSGNVLLDVTDRVGSILGISSTGTSNGSLTHAGFAKGQPWVLPLNPGVLALDIPEWSISGSTISWTFYMSGQPWNQNVRFYYGWY